MRLCSLALTVATAVTIGIASHVSAQTVGDVFRKVKISVVVIKAKGRDVASGGDSVRFTEVGSGVLIASDGKVMTAAHVVHAMDEISVEFTSGESIGLRGGRKIATIDGEKIVVGGDVILKVQGIPVNDFASYERIRSALVGLGPGATVTVTVLRAGQVLDLTGRVP